MKKTVLFAFLLMLVVSAIAGTLLIDVGAASPVAPVSLPPWMGGDVLILSPQNDKVYAVNSIPLVFAVGLDSSYFVYRASIDVSIRYSLDGELKGQIESKLTRDRQAETLSVNLTGLSEGVHRVQATAEYDFYVVFLPSPVIGYSDVVCFTVDTTPPRISILAPLDRTYDATAIPLNFVVREPVSWMGYSLDADATVTITGNTTLSGLAYGTHTLTVYANDTAGNTGSSRTIYFNIAQEEAPEEEPDQPPSFPTTRIVAATAVIAAVGAALAIYFAKIKRQLGKPNNSKIPTARANC